MGTIKVPLLSMFMAGSALYGWHHGTHQCQNCWTSCDILSDSFSIDPRPETCQCWFPYTATSCKHPGCLSLIIYRLLSIQSCLTLNILPHTEIYSIVIYCVTDKENRLSISTGSKTYWLLTFMADSVKWLTCTCTRCIGLANCAKNSKPHSEMYMYLFIFYILVT